MNLRELEAQAEFLAPVIAAAVAKAVAPLKQQLAEAEGLLYELNKQVVELPGMEDLEKLVTDAADKIVLPEAIPGKDAEPVDLDELAKAAAALIVLPEVKDGKDAESVDLEAVAALVKVPDLPEIDLDEVAVKAAALVPVPEVRQPQDGRDALHLEILPGIDEAKTYPRNTYAKHEGGLWRSFEQTSGMRGWECIVEGLKAVSVTQDGDREFSVTLAKSSGAEVVQKFAMPIQIYKGVHRDGEKYDQHDNVTWAGSQWTSTKAVNTDKPGSSDAWTLVVKAGRNGKDLRENASTFDASKGVKL